MTLALTFSVATWIGSTRSTQGLGWHGKFVCRVVTWADLAHSTYA